MRDNVFTVKELSDYLKVSDKTVKTLLRTGKIKANKVGREWRVLQSEVDKYLRGFEN